MQNVMTKRQCFNLPLACVFRESLHILESLARFVSDILKLAFVQQHGGATARCWRPEHPVPLSPTTSGSLLLAYRLPSESLLVGY